MNPTAPHDDTRQRLISTAGEIFAEHGFKAATVRDICAKAGANVAAINYHFGDKLGLYIEAVQAAHCGGQDLLQQDWPDNLPAPARLRIFIRKLLEHFLDDTQPSWKTRLMLRELADPTEACAKLVENYIRPMAEVLHAIGNDLVTAEVSEEQRWLIGFSIVGQCLFYKVHRPVANLLLGPDRQGVLNIDVLAEHISQFSLAALGKDLPVARDGAVLSEHLRRLHVLHN